jgi:hypothetical protein
MIAWWWLFLAIPLAFLVGVIFGSGLVLFDLTGLRNFFHELATEHPGLNRASRENPRNSINNQKQKNEKDREQVVYLASKKAQI